MGREEKIWHKGACHCGAVRFEVRAPKDVHITDCNCSMCAKTGYQHLIVTAEDFRQLSGQGQLRTYTFNTHTAKHYFCKTCGIKPFYVPRSHPDGMSVNLRCVEQDGFDRITFEEFDGQNWEANIRDLHEKT
jgi:hypothetical protein